MRFTLDLGGSDLGVLRILVMIFIAWNCRGLLKEVAENALCGMIRNLNLDVFLLTETTVNENVMD